MIKQVVQDPTQLKAIVSGATTTVLGFTVSAQELTLWASVLADLGVFAGGCVTVVLGVQSFIKSRNKGK